MLPLCYLTQSNDAIMMTEIKTDVVLEEVNANTSTLMVLLDCIIFH